MDIKWEQIIGHEVNIARLRKMLREGKLPHALLLSGPAGIGKRRIAQALAAALLCGEADAPCGVCPSCRAMEQGTHPDFYFIGPEARGKSAPAIRIEQVRELQAEAARLPVLAGRRVVLMDDAECMNEAAENCLLKTLEEPVGQTTFLLVTSARSGLLDTIVSRCMPLAFGMVPREDIKAWLVERGVPAAESEELAALSDGSFGRALMLREQGGRELREDAAAYLESLPRFSMEEVWRRGRSMGERKKEELSEWFLCLNLLLRDMLVLYVDGASPLLYHPGFRSRLAALLPEFPEKRILAMLHLVRETQRRLQANVSLRLLLESFFIRMGDTRDTRSR